CCQGRVTCPTPTRRAVGGGGHGIRAVFCSPHHYNGGLRIFPMTGCYMIIKPKVRGFICINAHPQGCAANVREQIAYTKAQGSISDGPQRVLVIGCSTGYGLASRITAAFGSGAQTLGICFEKPPTETKTGSAGYYNTAAFHEE